MFRPATEEVGEAGPGTGCPVNLSSFPKGVGGRWEQRAREVLAPVREKGSGDNYDLRNDKDCTA